MIKTGQVQAGKTPSVVSGLPSQRIVAGEPVVSGEKPVDPGLEKLASALDSEEEEKSKKASGHDD